MPDKKTLEKAKKAGEESEDEMLEAMPPEEDSEMGDDMGMEPEPMEMGMEGEEGAPPMASPEDAIQGALDEGVTSAVDMIEKLQAAGFEVVASAGPDPMDELPPPPTGMPDTQGGLRDQVRTAASRALGGMA